MLLIAATILPHHAQAQPAITEETFSTRLRAPAEMHFFIRWPAGVWEGGDVAGVLCYCTWQDSPEALRQQLGGRMPEGERNPAASTIEFADQHRLAVMAWTLGAGFWDRGVSADEQERARARFYDRLFSEVVDTWEGSVRRVVRRHNLPEDGWLMWGTSRGAQWAHRLALRKPQYFKAVAIHINSSYDAPTPAAAGIWWLATTGELENGYEAGKRWFQQCRELGYPIIFRGDPNRAHNTSPESERLRWALFELALAEPGARLPPFEPQWAGDLVNHRVVPWDQRDEIPEDVRVPLPNEDMADMFGGR